MMDESAEAPTPEQVAGLIEAIGALTAEVGDLKGQVKLEREARRDQERASNRRTGFLVAAIVVLIVGMFVNYSAANDAQIAVNEVTANRTESRIAVCDNDNHFIENHNKLVDASLSMLDLIGSAPSPNRTPEQQEAVDAFLTTSRNGFEATRVPPRDCSPEGIAAFYKGGNR